MTTGIQEYHSNECAMAAINGASSTAPSYLGQTTWCHRNIVIISIFGNILTSFGYSQIKPSVVKSDGAIRRKLDRQGFVGGAS